jgi:hypothetical protein
LTLSDLFGASSSDPTVTNGQADANYTDANGTPISVDPPVAIADHQTGQGGNTGSTGVPGEQLNYSDASGVSAAVDSHGNPIASVGADSSKSFWHWLLGDVPTGTPTATPNTTTNYYNPGTGVVYQAASGANHAVPPPPKASVPWWGWALLLGVGGVVLFGSAHLINTVKE